MAGFWRHQMVRVMPPWLQRKRAGAVLQAIGMQLDTLADRWRDSILIRFPDVHSGESLALIGRDRRIIRGENESDSEYASRLRAWWDVHRTRGGPYSLLEQLFAFLRSQFDGGDFDSVDLVYHSGTRRSIAPDGTITRDAITWNADGSDLWAQAWLIYMFTFQPTIGAGDEELLAAIPRVWNAAHVLPITVVVIWDGVRLWGYPQPVVTWGNWGTWPTDDPEIFTAE